MLLYNGQFIPAEELVLPLTNRAFQYNDGFFETLMVVHGNIRFWADHVARMQEAAQSLKLDLPSDFDATLLEQQLLQLAEKNDALKYGRLKLKVWRAGAGLYTPETNDIHWLASIQVTKPILTEEITIGICDSIKTVLSPFSHFKGPNAPVYTLAGIEKKQTTYDDMLLLSTQGVVAELISANLFWVAENKLFTPALDTGCVNGIARRNIIRWCQRQGIQVKEAYFSPERLLTADAVFAANVTGIRSISSIKGQRLQTSSPILAELHQLFK